LDVTTVSFPESPGLLLLALVPGLVATSLGAILFAKGWIRAVGATLAAVGLSLLSVVGFVTVVYGFAPYSDFADSPFLVLGFPLGVFVLALGLLLRRSRTSILASVLCAAAGLAALYWLGGMVLMQSVCSFHSGGC
jgi:hypothetical protein